jgi:hypothetical protein
MEIIIIYIERESRDYLCLMARYVLRVYIMSNLYVTKCREKCY